ncbi:glycosyltransferase [Acetobacter sp. TBRC 12305]|uniref:Glycosyltransferase n=2 Tax=Acetobacter garciniae TaxID=2817435 RepID=A0A939HKH2_9PROT|nr:glycosyltransferase [Acetobacter garciniae]MBX0345172.1 glycosyltransferase [Acetobacter garciniae]
MGRNRKSHAVQVGFLTLRASRARARLASASAQQAFARGNVAWQAGEAARAWDWLERANRLAPQTPHVVFALALARQAVGQGSGAIALVEKLLTQAEFREGWVLLASLCLAQSRNGPAGAQACRRLLDRAVGAVEHLLAHYACTPESAVLVAAVVRAAGLPGWCGVANGQGRLVLGLPAQPTTPPLLICEGQTQPAIFHNGHWFCPPEWCGPFPQGKDENPTMALPGPASRDGRVRVSVDTVPLFPPAGLNMGMVRQCEGLVESDGYRLHGWVWLPHDPDTVPELCVLDARDNTPVLSFRAGDFHETAPPGRPLARCRTISLLCTALPRHVRSGLVRILGPDGRDLAGSPLHPAGLVAYAPAPAGAGRAVRNAAGGKAVPDKQHHVQPPDIRKRVLYKPVMCNVSVDQAGPPASIPAPAPLAVVVPVYADRARTIACLQSLGTSLDHARTGNGPARVVVVNDASPDPAFCRAVADFCAQAGFALIERACNAGFPAAVNTGLREVPGHDVVVLNADTLVVGNWLAELRHVAYAAPRTGTVTPFSNEASLFSYPGQDGQNPMPDLAQTRWLMRLAQAANAGHGVKVPTANGFCMYIRHDCLARTGFLREDVFAQGYGEENDFCLRATARGWWHMAAVGAFVAHAGGASFGGAGAGLRQRNQMVLEHLHPGYHARIARWLARDALHPWRRRFDLVRLRASGPHAAPAPHPDAPPSPSQALSQPMGQTPAKSGAVLLITHAAGGGVARVEGQRVAHWRGRGVRVLVLRPGPQGSVLEDGAVGPAPERYPALVFRGAADERLLARLLAAEGVRHVEIHHPAGHADATLALPARLGCPYDVFVHDYIWLCQRVTLLGPGGRYCGEPGVTGCDTCLARMGRRVAGALDGQAYLDRARNLLAGARRVVVPSGDVAARFDRHFPGLKLHVRPLERDRSRIRATIPGREKNSGKLPNKNDVSPGRGFFTTTESRGRVRVCVVGAIGVEKGYGVLLQAGRDAARRNLPLEFVLVGHTPDDEKLMQTERIFVTGPYAAADAVRLIRSAGADIALLPSIWPETWCFALTELWRAGLHVLAFDIGTPALRIRATGGGTLVPPGLGAAKLNEILLKKVKNRQENI